MAYVFRTLDYVVLLINYRLCLHNSYRWHQKFHLLFRWLLPFISYCTVMHLIATGLQPLTSEKFHQPVVLVLFAFSSTSSGLFLIFLACPIDRLNLTLVFTQYASTISLFFFSRKVHNSLLNCRYT
jgi:hypothetical protein